MQKNNIDISPIKERFFQYLDYKGISKYKCYKETGIANSVLSQKNGFSEDSYIKIAKTYRDLNLIWLILGVGEMIIEIYNIPEKTNSHLIVKEVTPDFMLKRFEELVIENSNKQKKIEELESRLEQTDTTKKYTLPDVQAFKVAESTDELRQE